MPAHDVHGLALVVNAERQGTPATPGDLQRALTVTSGAVTGLVDRLVRAGHLRREPDPDDRRRIRLRSDQAGRRLGREFFGPLGARTDRIMAAAPPPSSPSSNDSSARSSRPRSTTAGSWSSDRSARCLAAAVRQEEADHLGGGVRAHRIDV